MQDEITFPAATNEDSSIVPEGRWTLELLRIVDAEPSSFRPEDGRRFKWEFALYDGPGLQPGERFYFNGEPYVFYRYTSKKNSPRATARKYAEALIGKKFEDGYIPTLKEMLGRRMSGVVAYEASEFDANQTVLKLLSLKSVGVPSSAAAQAPRPAPAAPASPGFDANGHEDNSALIEDIKKQIRKAELLQTPKHLDWLAISDDLPKSSRSDLEMLHQAVLNDLAA